MDIHVSFGPVDTRNPGCGYQLKIERALTGDILLFTSKAPDTGEDLRSAADCLRVAQMYAEKPAQADLSGPAKLRRAVMAARPNDPQFSND